MLHYAGRLRGRRAVLGGGDLQEKKENYLGVVHTGTLVELRRLLPPKIPILQLFSYIGN